MSKEDRSLSCLTLVHIRWTFRRDGASKAPETSPIRQSQSPRRIDPNANRADIRQEVRPDRLSRGLAATGKKRRHQDGELVDRDPGKSVNSPTPVTRF